jgi:hypothetical protein
MNEILRPEAIMDMVIKNLIGNRTHIVTTTGKRINRAFVVN